LKAARLTFAALVLALVLPGCTTVGHWWDFGEEAPPRQTEEEAEEETRKAAEEETRNSGEVWLAEAEAAAVDSADRRPAEIAGAAVLPGPPGTPAPPPEALPAARLVSRFLPLYTIWLRKSLWNPAEGSRLYYNPYLWSRFFGLYLRWPAARRSGPQLYLFTK
jgi:hypothetical protein